MEIDRISLSRILIKPKRGSTFRECFQDTRPSFGYFCFIILYTARADKNAKAEENDSRFPFQRREICFKFQVYSKITEFNLRRPFFGCTVIVRYQNFCSLSRPSIKRWLNILDKTNHNEKEISDRKDNLLL